METASFTWVFGQWWVLSHQSHQLSTDQQRARSQSLASSSSFLEGWRDRMPFLKRRQTIDHSRQSQPLMEEGRETAGQAKSAPGAVDRPTLMTTIAEDVAETGTAATSHAAATSDAAAAAAVGAVGATGAEEGHPNGMGTVIVRMERAGQQHMADEAL